MACRHWYSRLDITITRQMIVVGNEDEIRQNEPVSMRVAVSCPCGFSAIYNANDGSYPGNALATLAAQPPDRAACRQSGRAGSVFGLRRAADYAPILERLT